MNRRLAAFTRFSYACIRHGASSRLAPQRFRLSLTLAAMACILYAPAALAQELAPRAYWPAPNGTKVANFAYSFSVGDVITDPSLPVVGVDSRIHGFQFSYLQTFSLLGRTSSLQFSLPYSAGTTDAELMDQPVRRELSAIGDVRLRVAMNLLGAPTMDGPAFQQLRAAPRTIIGVSLMVAAPTGGYENDELLNVGTNRWGLKPAFGVIWPFRPTWMLEADAGVWFFTDNDEFLGMTREQAPILSTELHLIKRFRPGFWAAFDMTYYSGGRTTVDGTELGDLQRNARIGGTLTFPFKAGHAIRGSYSTGVVTESGGDFQTFSAIYLFVWR